MFYDFNIPYPSSLERADQERLENILARISSFQKATIALNQTITNSLKITQPLQPISPEQFTNIQQLTRVTLIVDDLKANYQLSSSNTCNSLIDILAVKPSNVDICKHACQSYEVDLISIDLSQRRVLPGYVSSQVAITRGIFFEICYTQGNRDVKKRSTFYSNARRLVETTRGKNLIFSSEALRALEIKRPSDLRMLGLLIGLTEEQVEAAVGYNYVRLLRKGETRKSTINAAISFAPPIGITEGKKRKENDTPDEDQESKKVKKTN
ncbi:RNase P subunit p30-domain-containing protein [Phycomyces nitens]|nr:RNase P subunit p30-domain-containing protein [Phycomyces nitens]